MKRILSSIVVLLIFFSCSANCYAAEYNETRTGGVYGKYNFYSNEGIYTAVSNNGCYELTTDDGVKIKIYSSSIDLTLIVHQISKGEKECYNWFENCIPQNVVSFVPYDIFFLDPSGERVELTSDIEIAISESHTNESILWLAYDGSTFSIKHYVNDNSLVFKTISNGGYYLLCKNASEIQSQQTGDVSCLYLWSTLFLVSLIVFIIITKRYWSDRKY